MNYISRGSVNHQEPLGTPKEQEPFAFFRMLTELSFRAQLLGLIYRILSASIFTFHVFGWGGPKKSTMLLGNQHKVCSSTNYNFWSLWLKWGNPSVSWGPWPLQMWTAKNAWCFTVGTVHYGSMDAHSPKQTWSQTQRGKKQAAAKKLKKLTFPEDEIFSKKHSWALACGPTPVAMADEIGFATNLWNIESFVSETVPWHDRCLICFGSQAALYLIWGGCG